MKLRIRELGGRAGKGVNYNHPAHGLSWVQISTELTTALVSFKDLLSPRLVLDYLFRKLL